MTPIQCRLAVPLVIVLLSFLAGCVTPPTKEELAALDYGACPQNYEAKIKEHFQGGPLTRYSGELIIWPPQHYWYKSADPFEGGKLYAGYLVVVMAHQTSGHPQLLGKQLYGFLFKDGELVKKLNPMQMQFLSTNETVGPVPRDERDWKQGHSEAKGDQLILEYVLPGETVQSWSELVSVQVFTDVSLEVTPEKLIADVAKKPGCAVVSKKTLASTPTEILYEGTLANCAPFRDEYSIRKAIRGPRTMTEVSYSKTTAMTDAEKKKWAEIVGRAKLLNECEPKR